MQRHGGSRVSAFPLYSSTIHLPPFLRRCSLEPTNTFEFFDEFGSRLVSLTGRFLEEFEDDTFEQARNAHLVLGRFFGIFVAEVGHRFDHVAAGERRASGQQSVDGRAEAEQVAPPINFARLSFAAFG